MAGLQWDLSREQCLLCTEKEEVDSDGESQTIGIAITFTLLCYGFAYAVLSYPTSDAHSCDHCVWIYYFVCGMIISIMFIKNMDSDLCQVTSGVLGPQWLEGLPSFHLVRQQ